MIHSIKPSYAVKVVYSRVHLLIADTFSETSQNTVKTLKNHLWIVDTYLVDVVHNRHLFMQQITTCPVFSGDETGFDAFFAKKKYWARKTFFSYIILTILFAAFSAQGTALLSPVFNRNLNSISSTTTHSFTNNHPWCATVR